MTAMEEIVTDVEQLTVTACLRLLGTVRIGRVALTQHALPLVIPVGFALDGDAIVIRTQPGSVLAGSRDDVVVAFEAGELDPDTGSGWTVHVTGTMHKIVGRDAITSAQQLQPRPWASDDRHHFVRIEPGLVFGSHLEHLPEPRPASA